MQRKDRVLESLRSLCESSFTQKNAVLRRHSGFSAEEVAGQINIDRTNASRDLNLLAQEGVIERIPGRPVLFRLKTPVQANDLQNNHKEITEDQAAEQPSEVARNITKLSTISASVQTGAVVTSFETLIGSNDGLKVAIQQAKAAILYPPRGLHTLLYGPSGVGKTTLARLMHAFAIELRALTPDAPFISFNCADYAGNPQLLMAHLFGVVRGAYTGAERDREGLVEQANRGILFLDEVHRLPPEGQEMLFYLMDRERFRRLGDVRERQSSLLLLAATTEDPNTTLLPTFRRRIPMTITLPGLQERTITERYELLRAFFTTECSTIGSNIRVVPRVLRAFLLYDCPGNIGQLRTDVQLTCARAYLEYRTNNQAELHVHTDTLPEHIRRGLLRTADLHRILAPVQHLLEDTHIFTPTGLSLNNFPESTHSLYDTINAEVISLRNSGLSEYEINKLIHLDIQNYFQHFAETVAQEQAGTASHLVSEHISSLAQSIMHYAEEQLKRQLPEKLALVLALHLSSALEHITQGRQLTVPIIPSVRQTYPEEYEIARIAHQRICVGLGVYLPESEIDVLAVLLANVDTLLSSEQATVGIVVAAHGRNVATGLAELANTLVGVNSVASVELTLEQSPEELLTLVEHCIYSADQGSGVLLLVDFASLLSLGDMITRRTGIQVRTVAGVCAPLVVEALRRAQRSEHITLDQLARSLLQFHIQNEADKMETAIKEQASTYSYTASTVDSGLSTVASSQTTHVILSICLTGYGSANKLAELLTEHLPELRRQDIEILCMDISLSGKTEAEVQHLVGNRHVIAVVGTINPHLKSYPFISLTEILFQDGIVRLRTLLGGTLIDPALLQPHTPSNNPAPIFTQRSDLLHEISHTLGQRLLFLNPVKVLPLIERMIELIEVEVGETFEIEVLTGLVLHLACVLERSIQPKGLPVNETLQSQVKQHYGRELEICRRAWQTLGIQVGRPLPEEEAYNIVGILRQVDIFV